MKKNFSRLLIVIVLTISQTAAVFSQNGFDIKINFKGCKDSTVYLARYFFDQMPIVDSCKNIRDGKIVFKGDYALPPGVYFLANQNRSSYYCQFIIDEVQKFSISFDGDAVAATLKTDEKQNNLFFSYIRFMTEKNKALASFKENQRGKSKADSVQAVNAKQSEISQAMMDYDAAFRQKNKGLFVADLMNLKAEKTPSVVPTASNGRPDSVYRYYYYKSHYFDGLNWKDNRIIYTPFFANRLKDYFEHLVPSQPDSVIKELDYILGQCVPGSDMFNTLVGHFTYKFEQNKTMNFDEFGHANSFEKVFIHLAKKYIVSGKTDGYYSAETISKINERITVLEKIQPGAKVKNLMMIDTTYGMEVLKMGFDTASSSESVTNLYQTNFNRLSKLFVPLYNVKAKYTILVFWAADCGHCKTEIPKLNKQLKKLDDKVIYSVYAVQTKEDMLQSWKSFIIENQLSGWTHVFDPIHLNNLKDEFDIVSTPIIYLLDNDKKIIGKKLAPDQVVEIIEKLQELESLRNKQ